MLAATPDCVNILSAEGVLLYMNVRGVELNELSSLDDVIGLNYEDTWPDEEREKVAAAIREAAAGEPFLYQLLAVLATPSSCHLHCSTLALLRTTFLTPDLELGAELLLLVRSDPNLLFPVVTHISTPALAASALATLDASLRYSSSCCPPPPSPGGMCGQPSGGGGAGPSIPPGEFSLQPPTSSVPACLNLVLNTLGPGMRRRKAAKILPFLESGLGAAESAD
ncbi:MAG: hypothetical protein WDW36_002974 [Sanguina aurantia]